MTSPKFLEVEELLEEIIRLSSRQHWMNAEGTEKDRLGDILPLAEELLHRHRHADDVYRRESR